MRCVFWGCLLATLPLAGCSGDSSSGGASGSGSPGLPLGKADAEILTAVTDAMWVTDGAGCIVLTADVAESAIREVFGNDIPHIASTKSLTGHCLGGAGVQEAIDSILMMQERFVGESAHVEELDPEFEGMPIVRKRIDDAKFDIALSNSFGFGGTNATLVMQRYNG